MINSRNFIKYLAPAVAVVLLFSACGKKESEESLKKRREMALSTMTEDKSAPPKPAPLPKDQKIEVPDAVKAKYHEVTMAVGDRKTKQAKKFSLKIGAEAQVPGSPYTIKVLAYLPHWVFKGGVITSNGVNPDDPAVRAVITEEGKAVFDGFIFQRHITPSFVTERYVITLTGAE